MASPQYAGPRWQRVRKLILARDGYVCQIRSKHCRTVANAVDHIIPMSLGGAQYDPSNLQAACQPCNSWKRNTDRDPYRDPSGRFSTPEPASGWIVSNRRPEPQVHVWR